MKYDKEEKAVVDAYEKGRMKLSTPSKKELEAIKATAERKTLVKDKTNNYTPTSTTTTRAFKKKRWKWVFPIKP